MKWPPGSELEVKDRNTSLRRVGVGERDFNWKFIFYFTVVEYYIRDKCKSTTNFVFTM